MCVDRNYAPHDLVNSRAESRQRNVQQSVVGAIQVQIAFVHFFRRRVENLNAANSWLDVLCESNSNLARGRLYRAAYARFRALKKSVSFKPSDRKN
jgi:hypothetical protein